MEQEGISMMTQEQFTFFWGGPFSQWHPSQFEVGGEVFVTAEQFMMAGKARLFGDEAMRERIMATKSPRTQKQLGRKVAGYQDDVWPAAAKKIVYDGNHAKFTQNPDLLETLLATAGTTLVEASPYDRRWGIGLREDDPRALDRATWRGTNWLGEVLTRLRDDLLKEKAS
jgi:ribA/ribD-fused uncharacterized protein